MAKGKGGAHGFGEGDNVHSGSGSKSGKTGTPRTGGDGHAGGDAGSATEKTHNVEFAQGGDTHMFGEQEAGSRKGEDKSPSTGKPDSSGPGEKFAEGGTEKMHSYTPAKRATAGITSAY